LKILLTGAEVRQPSLVSPAEIHYATGIEGGLGLLFDWRLPVSARRGITPHFVNPVYLKGVGPDHS